MNNNQNQPQQEEERPQMNLFQMMFLFFAIQTLMNRFMVPKPQEPSTADLLKQYNSTYALERKQDVQAPASSSPFSSMFGFAKDILPQQLGTKGKQYLSAIGKDEELVRLVSFDWLIIRICTFTCLIVRPSAMWTRMFSFGILILSCITPIPPIIVKWMWLWTFQSLLATMEPFLLTFSWLEYSFELFSLTFIERCWFGSS